MAKAEKNTSVQGHAIRSENGMRRTTSKKKPTLLVPWEYVLRIGLQCECRRPVIGPELINREIEGPPVISSAKYTRKFSKPHFLGGLLGLRMVERSDLDPGVRFAQVRTLLLSSAPGLEHELFKVMRYDETRKVCARAGLDSLISSDVKALLKTISVAGRTETQHIFPIAVVKTHARMVRYERGLPVSDCSANIMNPTSRSTRKKGENRTERETNAAIRSRRSRAKVCIQGVEPEVAHDAD
ncbi:uncharacterized protein FOMMEDRAFT_156457 [Fomitiporia mediterranea MF3/22]|uniref:uncharacterized protein n=1 Tax=Fomitiporia mediterranea (strain MF3/22) TaxID=694068 RepID=UPI0004409BCE|nr:uncharacterized protein FOMMEDRAFT_156457 [Fomitiporia mediterranea MF3/22]EJD03084.1 hypothetical protein FOMMEDRAFT_156457 [Fomitiporia mediterranea MF3/22]